MKILVTGAGSQLALALRGTLTQHEAVFLSRRELDISSLEAVRERIRSHSPALILNTAAYNHVDQAETDPNGAFSSNALGPRNLAVAAQERGIPLLHVSTDYVFDGTRPGPYHEWCRPNPLSIYGESKLAGEEAVRSHCRRHLIARTAWLYSTQGKNFPLTILEHARKGPVRVVTDQVGCPTYAPHLASGITRLVESGAWGTYHLAGRGAASWFDLAQALFQRIGLPPPSRTSTVEFPRPARRPARVVLETLQDPKVLLPSWEEGLDEFVSTLHKENPTPGRS